MFKAILLLQLQTQHKQAIITDHSIHKLETTFAELIQSMIFQFAALVANKVVAIQIVNKNAAQDKVIIAG